MVIIKDFSAPSNCIDCQNEDLSEIVGCGLFAECGKHPDCPFIEVKEGDVVERSKINEIIEKVKDESYLSYDDNPRHIINEEAVLHIIEDVLSKN